MTRQIKKLIKKLRSLIAYEKPEPIQEYEDDCFALVNEQIKIAMENVPRKNRDEYERYLRLRRSKPSKMRRGMRCDKCGSASLVWSFDEKGEARCLDCSKKRNRSPAVCWVGEAEQIRAIYAKSPPKTTNK